MRECHPALHLGGCTANQTGSGHASQSANQSAQQHLIQGMTDKQGRSLGEWMGGRVGGLQGMDVRESVSHKGVRVCRVWSWVENKGVMCSLAVVLTVMKLHLCIWAFLELTLDLCFFVRV